VVKIGVPGCEMQLNDPKIFVRAAHWWKQKYYCTLWQSARYGYPCALSIFATNIDMLTVNIYCLKIIAYRQDKWFDTSQRTSEVASKYRVHIWNKTIPSLRNICQL
jgi:hypothetical protein